VIFGFTPGGCLRIASFFVLCYAELMPAGVYLHIPYCKSRCSYCDFATDVYRSDEAVTRYAAALAAKFLVS
jgi:coproporphyrinogen III oxidase-like Fe-S oxidoreductase